MRDETPQNSSADISGYANSDEGIRGIRYGSEATTESSEGSGRVRVRRNTRGQGTPRRRERAEQEREAVEYIEDWRIPTTNGTPVGRERYYRERERVRRSQGEQ